MALKFPVDHDGNMRAQIFSLAHGVRGKNDSCFGRVGHGSDNLKHAFLAHDVDSWRRFVKYHSTGASDQATRGLQSTFISATKLLNL